MTAWTVDAPYEDIYATERALSERDLTVDSVTNPHPKDDFLLSREPPTHQREFVCKRGTFLLREKDELSFNWYAPICSKLVLLMNLQQNWDSYGAPPVNEKSILRAFDILSGIVNPSFSLPYPSVVPTAKGGVQLEWHRNGVDLEIEIYPDSGGAFSYEGKGEEPFEREDDPANHIELLQGLVVKCVGS